MNPNWKKIKKLIFIFLLAGFIVSVFPLFPEKAMGASYSPHSVPSDVRNNWNKTLGGKQFKQRTGRKLVYDVYSKKFTSGGYQIVNKNFGNGSQPYLNFQGWAVLQGRKRHTSSNHDTYIVAQKVGDSSNVKIYKTDHINLSATEELEYNNQGSGVWNECPANAVNKDNQLDCNMRYDNVGFNAFLPLNELFPNYAESASWRLYIVKVVDGHIVYTPLILPFSFDNRSYGWGEISLSSGVNANNLTMVGTNVIRRTYPRQVTSGFIYGYFTTGKTYTRIDSDETGTGVWYGVRSPHDNNAKRWAVTAYWNFGGDQAILKYNPENEPPKHISHSLTGNQYTKGNDYWVKPNTQVTIALRQYDKESGNKHQYLRLYGNGVDVRNRHDFAESASHNASLENFRSSHVSIDSARRTENTQYGRVEWKATPKTHGHNYDIQYFYRDNANNTLGYESTGMRLRVDGVAPTLNDFSISGYKYHDGSVYWIRPNDKLDVILRQHDGHSGNKFQYLRINGNGEQIRARHDFNNSSTTNLNQVSTFPTSTNNITITAAKRTENSAYGKVDWTITPRKHGLVYNLWWHFRDNVNNDRGYDTGIGSFAKIGADGVGPTIQFRNQDDTKDFKNREWSADDIVVRLKFSDEHSGYKRSRYAWSKSSSMPSENQWSNWTTSSNYLTSAQTKKGEWYLHVQAEDHVGNRTTTKSYYYKLNHPPEADMEYKVQPPNPQKDKIYEGDELKVCVTVRDEDDDLLNVKFYYIYKNEKVYFGEESGVKSGSTVCKNFTIGENDTGRYDIGSEVSDGIFEVNPKTWINALKLFIVGRVNHTPEWEKIHLELGHTLDKFYSGEKFLLEADVADYPIDDIKAIFRAYQADGKPIRRTAPLYFVTNVLYDGELFDEKWLHYPTNIRKGPAYFDFEVTYSNGVKKETIVPIEIIIEGNVFDVYKFHRRY